MDIFRYGLWHQVAVAAVVGWLVLGLAALLDLSFGPVIVATAVVFSLSSLVIDLLLTPARVFRDFRRGRFAASARGTRFLLRLTLRPEKKAALKLNQAACELARGDYETGGALLKEVDRDALSPELRTVWDNNYAYFLLGIGEDPLEALRICDQAMANQGNNPAFHGTRGLALLSLGRLDDAIAELCRSMEVGSLGSAGLAETYYYLGRAWEKKGENAYARDHFLKAINVAPSSPYGKRAAEELSRYLSL
jgi:tetratricopeptide (TPR) repeat protein